MKTIDSEFFRPSRFYLLSTEPPKRDRIDISKDFLKERTKGVGARIRLGHVDNAREVKNKKIILLIIDRTDEELHGGVRRMGEC